MGYLESAVVVYLRAIFYPDGFAFPLEMMTDEIALTEIFRELATLIMLSGIGILAGRNPMQRFGIFLYTFGIWDIFYYVFLKLLLGWPASLFTWDILFLIPVTWVGPVLAPVINALTMCILGGFIFYREETGRHAVISKMSWVWLLIGSAIILISYTEDYLQFMSSRIPLTDLFRPSSAERVMGEMTGYIPESFNWWVFGLGQILLVMAIAMIFRRKSAFPD